MERNPVNFTRECSDIVKKIRWATFRVIWARLVGYSSNKNAFLIFAVTHTTNHQAIHDASWVCLSYAMALQRTHFDNWDKNVVKLKY